jgi:DNA-binding Xre family transcriptional regulator
MHMAIQFRLREVIEKRQTTQSALSRDSGVSFATINRMCMNNTRQVSLEVIDALCNTLKVKPGELFDWTQEK